MRPAVSFPGGDDLPVWLTTNIISERITGGELMTSPVDRRAAERFPVNADVSCPHLSPVGEEFGAVKVRDISMAGIGLIVSRRVEPGALMAVTLANVKKGFT